MAGYTVAEKADYYSPLTSVSGTALHGRPLEPTERARRDLEYDLEQMKRDLSDLLSLYLGEFVDLPPRTKRCAGSVTAPATRRSTR